MPKAQKAKGKAKAKSESPEGEGPRHRAKPYRWDELGEPTNDATGWAKTNKRDKQKSDLMAIRLSSGEFNILPPELYCDRCKHARWPCIYPRGIASACCNGCAHSKLRCTRSINPTPLVIELTKQGYCNVDPALAKRNGNGLPTPRGTQTPPSGASTVAQTPAASSSTQAVTPAATPTPRLILRAPGYTPISTASRASESPTEREAQDVEAVLAPRTPVLPRGTAEPSRHLPPLPTLSRAATPEHRVSLPPISQPVSPQHRLFHSVTPLPPSSWPATPEGEPSVTTSSDHDRSSSPEYESPNSLRSIRPSISVVTQFSPPVDATPFANVVRKDAVLLKPSDARVPFLIPYTPNAEEAQMVRDLGITPPYMWRSTEPCIACSDEGVPSAFGNIYIPRQGWDIVRAPPCLRCQAVGRPCKWRLNNSEGLFVTDRLNFVILDSRGAMGTGVFLKASDFEVWPHAAIAQALHRGEDEAFDMAWMAVQPALLSVWDQYELGTPDGDTEAPYICTASVLAEDRVHRPELAQVVQALHSHEHYQPLLVSDFLRRVPRTEDGVEAGLLRAGDEWGAWSFADGELVLHFRDTPDHHEWDTKELEKLFLGEEPRYEPGRDIPFVHWLPRGPLRLPVLSVSVRFLNVEFVDMAAAMLHAVECAMAGTEIPETLEREHMKHIRERHRSLLADDAERGIALYELFRADLDACETAVRIAAHAPGIIQLK